MTAYVDDFKCRATINGTNAFWYHLTATTSLELEYFARKLGLNPAWSQKTCKYMKCPTVNGVCRHFHYDITSRLRTAAIKLGAVPITYREFGAITSDRRDKFTARVEKK